MNVDNLELALSSIRVYASEHGLSGYQVRAMFSPSEFPFATYYRDTDLSRSPWLSILPFQKTHIQDLANRSLDLVK
jgi:hypothetical protein